MLKVQDLRLHYKADLVSGFIVFLIALPLSIGIALASGAPPMAGLYSAILGGVLGSFLSGGHVTIFGPAAGLIVVVLHSVHVLGWPSTSAAIFFAGLMQVVLGVLKSGRLASCVPGAVIHGLLASIGVTIIVKQFFVLSGVSPESHETLIQILEIPKAVDHANWVVAIVGLSCVAALVVWSNVTPKWLRVIPGPVVAVGLGIFFDKFFDIEHVHRLSILNHEFTVGAQYLLHIPDSFVSGFALPDFAGLARPVFWQMVITIALVSSIETLLSSHAVDKLDPMQRKTNFDFELVTKGFINSTLGLIGGLPVIAEIVRSQANLSTGAKTLWSNFFHGLFILVFVAFFPHVLNLVPLASFAAILIFVGFSLVHPSQFKKAWRIGGDHFLVFVATLFFVLATDILIGVLLGLSLDVLVAWWRSGFSIGALWPVFEIHEGERETVIYWKSAATFLSLMKIQSLISKTKSSSIEFNFQDSPYVDHTLIEYFEGAVQDLEREGISLRVVPRSLHLVERK